MRKMNNKNASNRSIGSIIIACVILFSLGCNLFSPNYWVHRLDDEEATQAEEPKPIDSPTIDESGTDSSFGSKCLNSPGDAPCPIDACVVYKGEYSAKNVVTSDLFGKANSSDYQCCAEYQFTNNSGVDLMAIEHLVTEFDNNWYIKLYPAKNPGQPINCSNYFNRKDGIETFSKGVAEIVVLYANPHCDWIEWDEPGLAVYRVPIEAGCYPF